MSRQFTRDFLLEVTQGNIPGHRIMRGLGEREGGSNVVGEDIWRGNDLNNYPSSPASHTVIPTPDSAGEQMTVISQNNADNGTSATGALTIGIDYLDASGNEQTTSLTMNGRTAVDLTPSDVRFVQDMYVTSVGSNTVAEGDIRIYKNSDDTLVYSMIAGGGNMSMVPHKMVPLGKTLHLKMWVPGEAQLRRCAIRLRADCTNAVPPVRQAGVFLFKSVVYLRGTSAGAIPLAYTIPALSIVKASAFADQTGADTSVHWWGVLIDD